VDTGHYYCYNKCNAVWIKASDEEVLVVDEVTFLKFLNAKYYDGDDTPYVLLYCKDKSNDADEDEHEAVSENGYRYMSLHSVFNNYSVIITTLLKERSFLCTNIRSMGCFTITLTTSS
jgi:hypothetical protein